jgi:dihydroorotase
MQTLRLTKPDDWHVHFRDDEALGNTVNATAKDFARALAMPNLIPALTTKAQLFSYRKRIKNACDLEFTPFMTFYLNESVCLEELAHVTKEDFILGAKLYPQGATTNSEQGVSSLETLYQHFDVMQENELVLQIHGEAITGDIFHREQRFIDEQLTKLIKNFPKLKIVFEHVSTKHAIEFINAAPKTVAATITVHHLLYNRNHLLAGGIKPHYYCLPILKQQNDQIALLKAATSGNPKFFLGTDSAPHSIANKQSACGCAGIYSAPYALCLYAKVFEQCHALDKLDDFASRFGAEFYQLPRNGGSLQLIKKSQKIPTSLAFGNESVIPIESGQLLDWSIDEHA